MLHSRHQRYIDQTIIIYGRYDILMCIVANIDRDISKSYKVIQKTLSYEGVFLAFLLIAFVGGVLFEVDFYI